MKETNEICGEKWDLLSKNSEFQWCALQLFLPHSITQVTVDGKEATGTGRTKKDAKHVPMLKTLVFPTELLGLVQGTLTKGEEGSAQLTSVY